MGTKNLTRLLVILVVVAFALWNPLYKVTRPGGIQSFTDLFILGLDLRGGADILMEAVPPPGYTLTPDDMAAAIEVIRNRVDPQGTREIIVTQVGNDRIQLQVPGVKPKKEKPDDLTLDEIKKLIGQTAVLEVVDTRGQYFQEGEDLSGRNFKVIVSGDDVKSASADPHPSRPGLFVVNFTLRGEAVKRFAQFTSRNVGRPMCILLDKKVLSCPRINSPITQGSGYIENDAWTRPDEPLILARQINAGRLPVPLRIIQDRVVGPTLGQESLNASIQAGMWGLILVLAYMFLFYRLPGLVADIALLLYGVITLGFISLFGITLTLPGIAGLILSFGMAVDANVIIFERIREEVRWGKPVAAAIEAGFNRALVAIIDGNVTTILMALMLMWLGSGPVRGFAITLTLGIVVSFFSAIYITRFLLELFISQGIKAEKLYV